MNWFKNLFKEKVEVTEIDPNVQKKYDFKAKILKDINERELDIDKNADKPIKPLDLMKVKFVGSPNYSNRKAGEEPIYIILHHTGPGTFNGIVKWLCDKKAKASAHYVLGTNAQLAQLVNTKRVAWHAGRAIWRDDLVDNSRSIGIEICNIGRITKETDGFYYNNGRQRKKYTGAAKPEYCEIMYPDSKILSGYHVPYPEKQMNKLVALCKALVEKYPNITRDNILTHYDIAQPLGRKEDPFGLDIERVKHLIFN